jgi:hypothetical protein
VAVGRSFLPPGEQGLVERSLFHEHHLARRHALAVHRCLEDAAGEAAVVDQRDAVAAEVAARSEQARAGAGADEERQQARQEMGRDDGRQQKLAAVPLRRYACGGHGQAVREAPGEGRGMKTLGLAGGDVKGSRGCRAAEFGGLDVKGRNPAARLLASSASLEPSSSTARRTRAPGSSAASCFPRLSRSFSPSRSPIKGVSKSEGVVQDGISAGSGSASERPATGSGHGMPDSGSPVAAAKKEPRRWPARTAQARSWLVEEVSVSAVRSKRRERPRLT